MSWGQRELQKVIGSSLLQLMIISGANSSALICIWNSWKEFLSVTLQKREAVITGFHSGIDSRVDMWGLGPGINIFHQLPGNHKISKVMLTLDSSLAQPST